MTPTDERASRSARVRAAAHAAAVAFGPNYRQAREEMRGLRVVMFTRIVAWLTIVVGAVTTLSDVVTNMTAHSISVDLPVQQFWPTLPAGARITGGPTAQVTGGGFISAPVTVSGLDPAARAWIAASSFLQGATIIMIAVIVVILTSRMLRNDPFRPAVARGIGLLGITVIVGGPAWQICSGIGETLASTQVLQLGSAAFKDVAPWNDLSTIIGFPQPTFHVQVDFWPIWVGLAMLVLAAAFRYGERLQRDTEGLV